MGGDLSRNDQGDAPGFLIRAARDSIDANLDRIQVVKGWLDTAGKSHEKVFNVAWAGNRELDSEGKLPAIGNTVNEATAAVSNSIGTDELSTLWVDPEFDASVAVFYYIRALQIPTARHSLYDAIALQITETDRGAKTIQERAYSSPIWYTP